MEIWRSLPVVLVGLDEDDAEGSGLVDETDWRISSAEI